MTDQHLDPAGAGHPHAHDPLCGHPAVAHDDHLDYLHDGRRHHEHAGHVDEHADDETADLHLAHVGHMHVHGPSCGHPTVEHADHRDFVHGIHRHAGHGTHYDEH